MDKQQQSNEEVINGYVDHIIFRNNDNGYTVMVMICDEEELTCVGIFSDIAEGECIEAHGEYTDHPTYGRQFSVKSFEEKAPQDELAIERYLGSGAIKGIGIALAARIVRRFREDTMRIIGNKIDIYLPMVCVLDFRDVTFMDSSGIAIVIHAIRRMRELRGVVRVENVPPQPMKVLKASGMERIVVIEERSMAHEV